MGTDENNYPAPIRVIRGLFRVLQDYAYGFAPLSISFLCR